MTVYVLLSLVQVPLKFFDLPTVLMAKLIGAFTLLRVLMFHHHFPDAIDK